MKIQIECGACAVVQMTRTLGFRAPDRWQPLVPVLMNAVADSWTDAENPGQILTALYDRAATLLQDGDPYQSAKDLSNEWAEMWWRDHAPALQDLSTHLHLAVAGNAIDAGVDANPETVWSHFKSALASLPAHDDRDAFLSWLGAHPAARILYLLDNCGEAVMDRELIRALTDAGARITAVVKGGPILNDITEREARMIQLDQVATLLSNGSNALGVVPGRVSQAFTEALQSADAVIAKGIAHLETLSHRPLGVPVLFLYRAKCPPSARLMGVPDQAGVVWWRTHEPT